MKISKKRLSLLISEVYKGLITRNPLDVIETVPNERIHVNPNASGQAGIDAETKETELQDDGSYRLTQDSLNNVRRHRRALGKYHRSKKASMQFKKYYDKVFKDGDGYLAPVYGGEEQSVEFIFRGQTAPEFEIYENDRFASVDLSSLEAQDILRNIGFDESRIISMNHSKDTVIVPISSHMSKGFMASPWVIFHAIIDSQEFINSVPVFKELGTDVFIDEFESPTSLFDEFSEEALLKAHDVFPFIITTASGVNQVSAGGLDTFNDMVLQSLFEVGPSKASKKKDPGLAGLGPGASLNPRYRNLEPEVQAILEKAVKLANACAEIVRDYLQGKVIVVEV